MEKAVNETYEEIEDDFSFAIEDYDISSNPNDFNIMTINSLVEKGVIRIPSFQRNYVWDRHRASKWIESLLLGLPVPQIFLYEQARNDFIVIDGQQRLMSVYYFVKGRFPRKQYRSEIRRIIDENGGIPDKLLQDNALFEDFKLRLPSIDFDKSNPFDGLTYESLDDWKSTLDLRTIRSIIIKQNKPEDGDSSVFEIFNRLNTGGTNLKPQEIRTCMYHSGFYDMLRRINSENRWRRFNKNNGPDIHLRDVEILLRAFAILVNDGNYRSPMQRFLNDFSKTSMKCSEEQNEYLEGLFIAFLDACSELPDDAFLKTSRFNVALFEAVFYAACHEAYQLHNSEVPLVNATLLQKIESDAQFREASAAQTTNTANLLLRLERAEAILRQES